MLVPSSDFFLMINMLLLPFLHIIVVLESQKHNFFIQFIIFVDDRAEIFVMRVSLDPLLFFLTLKILLWVLNCCEFFSQRILKMLS